MALTRFPYITLDEVLARLEIEAAERFATGYVLAQELYEDRLTIADIPRLQHGLQVANTLLDLGMDIDTVVAGLLNHAVTPEEFQQIDQKCGHRVATMIAALRRLDIYTAKAKIQQNTRTIEAIRRALLSLIDGDVRVVLIRLAMSLHTLRESVNLDQERRILIAQDVRNIYAPLANRLGIWQLKWQLEDLSFRYLEPEKYQEIAEALSEHREVRNLRVREAIELLRQKLGEYNIEAEVSGRSKHIYSIHRKMVKKKLSFDRLFDIHALRIIIESDDPENEALTLQERKRAKYTQCYRALGIVHSIWTAIPSEFDDYIQHPKQNGYRSLHTAVYGEDGRVLEIQIRTRRMHESAEQGVAAHWAYKEGGRPSTALMNQIDSLRNLLEAVDDNERIDWDANNRKGEAINESVYVFTPDGDVLDLPTKATPIDFAYSIHTQVGHRCRGAVVNSKMVPLNYQLQSGDTVSIITSGKDKPGRPSRDWMNPILGYTVTNRAQSRIRQWFRENEREKNIEYGRVSLDRELKRLKLAGEVTAEKLAVQQQESAEDFLAKIGFGDITMSQLEGMITLLSREIKENQPKIGEESEIESMPISQNRPNHTKKGLIVMGMSGLHTTMAQCCHPIPPEPLTGYVTRGRGVTIHRADCPHVLAKEKQEPERIVDVDWGEQQPKNGVYSVPFNVKAQRTSGLLEKIASILKGQNINLLKTKSTNRKNEMAIFLLAEVKGMEQVKWIQSKLENLDAVYEVRR